MLEKINEVIDKIRPALINHGGDIKIISWNEEKKELTVSLQGHCVGCIHSQMTLKNGIENSLREAVDPDIVVINTLA